MSKSGYVKLIDDKKAYFVNVRRDKKTGRPRAVSSNLLSNDVRALYAVLVDRSHPLSTSNLTPDNVKEYLKSLTDDGTSLRRIKIHEAKMKKRKEERDELQSQKDSLKPLLDERADLVKRIEQLSAEQKNLSDRLDRDEIDREEVLRNLPEAAGDLKFYRKKLRQLERRREEINAFLKVQRRK